MVRNVPPQENTGWIFILNKGYRDLLHFRHFQKARRQTFIWPAATAWLTRGAKLQMVSKNTPAIDEQHARAAEETLLRTTTGPQKNQLFLNFAALIV